MSCLKTHKAAAPEGTAAIWRFIHFGKNILSAGFSEGLSRLSTELYFKRSDYSSAKYLMVRTI